MTGAFVSRINCKLRFAVLACWGAVVVVAVEAWRLELARRSPKNSAWLLYLKGIIALPTARNSNEVARAR